MTHSSQNGAPAKKSKNTRKKDKAILLREIANQKREIGRFGLFCYISGRSPDKSGDLATLHTLTGYARYQAVMTTEGKLINITTHKCIDE